MYSSSTSIRSISATLARLGDFCSGFSTRWKVKRTASALNGSPLWKTTPRRRRNCQVRSSRSRHDSASAPTIFPSASRSTRESKMLTPTCERSEERFMVGSRFSGVHGIATRSSPWAAAGPASPPTGEQGQQSARARRASAARRPSCPGLPDGVHHRLEMRVRHVQGQHAAGGDDVRRRRRSGRGRRAPRRPRPRRARGAACPILPSPAATAPRARFFPSARAGPVSRSCQFSTATGSSAHARSRCPCRGGAAW